MIVEALVIGGGLWAANAIRKWLWPADAEKKTETPAGFDEIPKTTIVDLKGVGKVRFFDANTSELIVENLAGAYTAEYLDSPAIGDHAAWITPYFVTGPSGSKMMGQPKKGDRAFDWITDALNLGEYVLTVARTGAGPWDPKLGDNAMIAVKASGLTHPDIYNDFAVVATPEEYLDYAKLSAMETPELLANLSAVMKSEISK